MKLDRELQKEREPDIIKKEERGSQRWEKLFTHRNSKRKSYLN